MLGSCGSITFAALRDWTGVALLSVSASAAKNLSDTAKAGMVPVCGFTDSLALQTPASRTSGRILEHLCFLDAKARAGHCTVHAPGRLGQFALGAY